MEAMAFTTSHQGLIIMNQSLKILAVLILARTIMAFQFQSVAALGPVLVLQSGISYTQLGMLVGIFLLPGTFLAFLVHGWGIASAKNA